MIRLVIGAFVVLFTSMSGLLVYEYTTLKQETARLVEIRDEYQTYTTAFRKILRDYQRLKDDDGASEEDEEKKKEERSFLVLNREPSHLASSTQHYLKERRMGRILSKLQASGQWVSTDAPSLTARHGRMHRRRHRYRDSVLVAAQLARHRALMRGKTLVTDISFAWPIDRSHFWISSFFGMRRKPDRTWGFHYGIDMAAIKGTAVKAAGAGVVVEAGNNKGYGNTVVIMHDNKYRSRYAHLQRISVRVGQQVEQGQYIGTVGDTGLVRKRGRYASHLHFEVYVHGKKVNPLYFFI